MRHRSDFKLWQKLSLTTEYTTLSFLQPFHTLPDRSLRKCLEVASETWLTMIPIAEQGFHLHKGAFRDAICLRYCLTPPHLPIESVCGSPFNVDHAMNCKWGGLLFIRHNELQDITAELLTEVCSDVIIEPPLQSLSGECFNYCSANINNNAHTDIAASGFWSPSHCSFFDVRVYNPFASVYSKSKLKACHRRNELEKRWQYDERIRTVEHGSLTLLVFTTAGGMGQSATTFYKFLASLISDRCTKSYSHVFNWIRCQLSFSLLRSAVLCLRGARSSLHRPVFSSVTSLDLATMEGKLDTWPYWPCLPIYLFSHLFIYFFISSPSLCINIIFLSLKKKFYYDKSTLERVSNPMYCCINGIFHELHHKSAMNII